MISRLYAALCVAAFIGMTMPAMAHPHVWITMSETLEVSPDGMLTGIRHKWVFDDAYSAFAVQGLARDKDGHIGKDVLAPLAKSNTADLAEYHYFTSAKSDGKPLVFNEPLDPTFEFDGKAIIYTFTLPLKQPIKPGRTTVIDITDPTYFVSFSFTNGNDAAMLSTPIKACSVIAKKPPEDPQPVGQPLSEAAFNALNNASYGLQFASHIILAC